MPTSDSAFHSPGVRSDHRRMELIYQHNDKPEQKDGKVGFSNMQVPWYAPPIARHTLEPKPPEMPRRSKPGSPGEDAAH